MTRRQRQDVGGDCLAMRAHRKATMSDRIEIDEVTLICRQCGAEHTRLLDRVLVGAEELIAWMNAHVVKFCACDSQKCDIKARLRNPDVLQKSK